MSYEGSHVPLPEWFRQGHSCKLQVLACSKTSRQIIRVFEMSHPIQYVKSKGRPPYSSKLIRFALMQRYTSRQSYKLLLEEMPLPSFSLLKIRVSQGLGLASRKAMKIRIVSTLSEVLCLYIRTTMKWYNGVSTLEKSIPCLL